jgi:hypothetical protein
VGCEALREALAQEGALETLLLHPPITKPTPGVRPGWIGWCSQSLTDESPFVGLLQVEPA